MFGQVVWESHLGQQFRWFRITFKPHGTCFNTPRGSRAACFTGPSTRPVWEFWCSLTFDFPTLPKLLQRGWLAFQPGHLESREKCRLRWEWIHTPYVWSLRACCALKSSTGLVLSEGWFCVTAPKLMCVHTPSVYCACQMLACKSCNLIFNSLFVP